MSSKIELVKEFSELINSCKGKVIFVTEQGDRLVADSMLSALVGFATILSVAETINVSFECEFESDHIIIHEFMAKYHLGPYRVGVAEI
jgi:hypothetical protein